MTTFFNLNASRALRRLMTLGLASLALARAQNIQKLAEEPTVKAALDAAKHNEAHYIDEQIRICEIPAPPFHEDTRGKDLERLFQQLGLQNVRIDKAGNVIGVFRRTWIPYFPRKQT
jgi:hypothetical protein